MLLLCFVCLSYISETPANSKPRTLPPDLPPMVFKKLFVTPPSGTWTLDDLKKLAGLNFLRVFKAVEKVGKYFGTPPPYSN